MGKKFQLSVSENIQIQGLKSEQIKPLNIKCGSTQCSNGLHCFSRYMKNAEKKFGKKGVCYKCGHDSIDWNRIHKNDLKDAKYLFDSLDKELMRRLFSTIKIEKSAIAGARQHSRDQLRLHAKKTLKTRVGKYNDYIDGKQTPLGEDDIVNYAQHATGTCCRQCMDAWHNIPKENPLTEAQLEFCTDLVMLYVDDKTETDI